MLEAAEKEGSIKPGGTVIEGTSGNTGMGLALAAAIKGYQCIFTMPDKMSQEKIDALRALGAEVIVTPTQVDHHDPRSYHSVALRLSREIPNSVFPNQYENPANADAHYETTGPEIWEQTEGKVTHVVIGVGTGGTITGVARFLKEKNPGDSQSSAPIRRDRFLRRCSRRAASRSRSLIRSKASVRTKCRAMWTFLSSMRSTPSATRMRF